jgi:4-carboxymuconolactone decarboxylase
MSPDPMSPDPVSPDPSTTSGSADVDRRFGPLAEAAMSPRQRQVAAAILAGPRGASTKLAGPYEAMLRSPELAERLQRAGEYVRFDSSLPPRLNELAILLTARRWTAQFEWYAHHHMAIAAGLDPEIADAIARNEVPSDLDADAAAVYGFVQQLLGTGSVDDPAFADVRSRFGEMGAVDLIGVVGYYCIVAFFLNVDRYPVPDGRPPLRPA